MQLYKIITVKNICFTFLLLCCYCNSNAQTGTASVEYREGTAAMNKLIYNYLVGHHGVYDLAPPEIEQAGNKYFVVTMMIDPNGALESCSILSLQDTTNATTVLAAAMQTNGHWINHAATAKLVMLPLYFIYRDYSRREERDPVKENYFYPKGFRDIICLAPLVIEYFPSVR